MSLDRAAVINRIGYHIRGSSTPRFRVIVGNPTGLPADGSPYATFAYGGNGEPPEGPMTLGNRMNRYSFRVSCFWHIRPEYSTLEALELEMWQADDTLRTAFWGDASLNGESTDLDITDTVTDEEFFPLQSMENARTLLYRTLSFDLLVKDLEGEAITL